MSETTLEQRRALRRAVATAVVAVAICALAAPFAVPAQAAAKTPLPAQTFPSFIFAPEAHYGAPLGGAVGAAGRVAGTGASTGRTNFTWSIGVHLMLPTFLTASSSYNAPPLITVVSAVLPGIGGLTVLTGWVYAAVHRLRSDLEPRLGEGGNTD